MIKPILLENMFVFTSSSLHIVHNSSETNYMDLKPKKKKKEMKWNAGPMNGLNNSRHSIWVIIVIITVDMPFNTTRSAHTRFHIVYEHLSFIFFYGGGHDDANDDVDDDRRPSSFTWTWSIELWWVLQLLAVVVFVDFHLLFFHSSWTCTMFVWFLYIVVWLVLIGSAVP